jgi:hypothetical protein
MGRVASCGSSSLPRVRHARQGQDIGLRLLEQPWSGSRWDAGCVHALTRRDRSPGRLGLEPDALECAHTGDHAGWISPELIEGAQPAPPSDVYAFGILLYEVSSRCSVVISDHGGRGTETTQAAAAAPP